MKISNLPYGLLFQQTQRDGVAPMLAWLEHCRACGFDGVEVADMWLRNLQPEGVQAVRQRIHDLGLAVSCFNVWNCSTNAAPGEKRDQAVAAFAGHAATARSLGAACISPDGGAWADFERYAMSRSQAVDRTVDTILRCVPPAQEAGLTILLENHPGWLTRYADVLEEMLGRLPAPAVMLNLDTLHMYRERQTPEDFYAREAILSRVRYLHLKPARFEPDVETGRWNQNIPFEQSQVDYGRMFRCLRAAGFDHWISYEAASGLGLQGLGPGAAFIRKAWAEAT